MRETRTLYRATDGGDGLWSGTCWAADREDAEAYLDNPGYGGAELHEREVQVDPELVLDLRTETGVDMSRLAEALVDLGWTDAADPGRVDTAEEIAERWGDRGWLYPWEEDMGIAEALAERYEWMRYTDTFPEGAETWTALRDMED